MPTVLKGTILAFAGLVLAYCVATWCELNLENSAQLRLLVHGAKLAGSELIDRTISPASANAHRADAPRP